jgi:hypothetical protein
MYNMMALCKFVCICMCTYTCTCTCVACTCICAHIDARDVNVQHDSTCIYVLHTFVSVCARIRMYVCTNKYSKKIFQIAWKVLVAYVYTRVHSNTHIYTYTCIHAHIKQYDASFDAYVYSCIHSNTNIYTHTYMHVYSKMMQDSMSWRKKLWGRGETARLRRR